MKALAVGAWILGPGASALWGQSAGPTPHDSAHAVASARQAALDFFHNGAIGQARDKPSRPPALSCAVAADGKVVWAEAYGFADLEQRVPATTETGFRIGSVSKTLTAAAVVLLHQRGQLDIDVPIQQYVPTFPDKGYPITIRELAGHLGGIRHYRDADFPGRSDNVRHYDSLAQALAIFANDSLVAPPGTTWAYSSYGFNLIGIALEHATGKPFLDLMRDEVFAPLGMRHTTTDDQGKLIPRRARFYEVNADGTYRNAEYIDESYKWPAGGMLSTPTDLATFGSALLHPGFLSSGSLALLFTSQHTSAGEETGYGMGWQLKQQTRTRSYWHRGAVTGGHANLVIYPDKNVVAACAENTDLVAVPISNRQMELIAEPFFAWAQRSVVSSSGVR